MIAPKQFPQIPGFDLNAGPVGLDDPKTVRASRRRGALRWKSDEDLLPEYLRNETLDRTFLNTLTAVLGPSARSGEDLPPLGRREVQLVSFCATGTVHCECWAISARQGTSRIRYRFSDEGDPEGVCGARLALQTTTRWPTLGKLIWMIDTSDFADGYQGLYFWALADQVSEHDADPASLFSAVEVYSHFYPQLAQWYAAAVRAWAAEYEQTGELDSCPDTVDLMQRHHTIAREASGE